MLTKIAIGAGLVALGGASTVAHYLHDYLTSSYDNVEQAPTSADTAEEKETPIEGPELTFDDEFLKKYEIPRLSWWTLGTPDYDKLIKSKMGQAEELRNDVDKTSLENHENGDLFGIIVASLFAKKASNGSYVKLPRVIILSLRKGDHFLFYRSVVEEVPSAGPFTFQHTNQAFKLIKDSKGEWKIDHGYLWRDKELISFKLTDDRIYHSLCDFGGGGDRCVKDIDWWNNSYPPFFDSKMWKSQSSKSGKRMLQQPIEVIERDEAIADRVIDVWGTKDEELFKGEMLGVHVYEPDKGFYKMNRKDKKIAKANITKWFEPFKDEIGYWGSQAQEFHKQQQRLLAS